VEHNKASENCLIAAIASGDAVSLWQLSEMLFAEADQQFCQFSWGGLIDAQFVDLC